MDKIGHGNRPRQITDNAESSPKAAPGRAPAAPAPSVPLPSVTARDSFDAEKSLAALPIKQSRSFSAAEATKLPINSPAPGGSVSLRASGSSPQTARSTERAQAFLTRARASLEQDTVASKSTVSSERQARKDAKSAKFQAKAARIAAGGPSAPQAAKETKQERDQRLAQERKAAVRASRIPTGIDNKELLTASDEKYSNYALNTAHPHGKHKAERIIVATGLTPVTVYGAKDAEVAMTAAANDPVHLAERAHNMTKIVNETRNGAPAQRQETDEYRARMDTKHKLEGPTGTKTVRAQWAYPRHKKTGTVSNAPHLAGIQPSDTSSEEGEAS